MSNFLKEIVLLRSVQLDVDQLVELFVFPGLRDLVKIVIDGDLESIFRSEFVAKLFAKSLPSPQTSESLSEVLVDRINNFLNENTNDQEDVELRERYLTVLLLGVAALQLFVYNNWRTNRMNVVVADLIPLVSMKPEVYFRDQLVVDGLHVYDNALCPQYLWIAEKLLLNDRFHVTNQTVSWWRQRCLFIHQQVVDDISPTLHDQISKENSSSFEALDKQLCLAGKTDLRVQLYIEMSRIKIFYHDVTMAATYLNRAKNIAGLDIDFTGVLGKRTRFQQKDVAQLVVKVTACESIRHTNHSPQTPSTDIATLPKNLALNDDVRLEKMALHEPSCSRQPHLNTTEQALHIALCLLLKKNSPGSELKNEELQQLIENVLTEPQSWFIQSMALFLRSQLEGNHRRTVERAMMQMQVLVEQYKLDNVGSPKYHLPLVYASCLPPFWVLETELAHLFLKLGAVSSALDLYLALRIWEDVIACYHMMHRKEKAEAVIRERLAVAETPMLWCHLGDATGEPEHYVRAWETSNHRLARAQKSLGLLHFQKRRYEESIPHFLKCVDVNAFQLEAWSCLAFAAMQTEDWELAARAYRRCTNLDSENHEVWNNLANVYLKLKDKERAWRTLQEAIRCSYEDWRIWENYLLASVDCGAFSEVITAYNRIFDLKGKHIDAEILEILVKVVISGVDDREGNSASLLRPALSKLFGRITANITKDGQAWRLYAQLIASNDDTQETNTRVVQYLQRAHHCFSQASNWEEVSSKCLNIFQVDMDLAKACMKLDSTQFMAQFSSAKLTLNGTIVRLKKYYEKMATKPSDEIGVQLTKLEDELTSLTNEVERAKQNSNVN